MGYYEDGHIHKRQKVNSDGYIEDEYWIRTRDGKEHMIPKENGLHMPWKLNCSDVERKRINKRLLELD